MSISKKLFILLIITMILVTLSTLTLVLTGHEDMVRDVFRMIENAAAIIGAVVLMIFVILVLG